MPDIQLSRPDISEREIEKVVAVLRSGQLSIGPWQERFEKTLAGQVTAAGAVAVSSGTAALDLCMQALDIGPGDEVITPSFTFVASVNSIVRRGAIPVFVDIDPESMNLDPQDLDRCLSEATRAVLAVHLFGRPIDMGPVLDFCTAHRLRLIEDACEALGATWHDRPVGSIGDCGVFGFYPNKVITTGEGGAIVSNDYDLLSRCAALRNQGRTAEGFLSGEIGHNYRLSELACALGAVQLERLDDIMARRAHAAAIYEEILSDLPGVTLPAPGCEHGQLSWFVYVVRIASMTVAARDQLIAAMRTRGIHCADYFEPVHSLDYYRRKFRVGDDALPATRSVAGRTLALPFYTSIEEQDQRRVGNALSEILGSDAWRAQLSGASSLMASAIGVSQSR